MTCRQKGNAEQLEPMEAGAANQGKVFLEEIRIPLVAAGLVLLLWLIWPFWGVAAFKSRIEANFAAEQVLNVKKEGVSSVPRLAASSPIKGAAPAADIDSESKESAEVKIPTVGDHFAQLGQTGDLFGGINALFAAFALIGVGWAASMQWRAMSEARQATAEQRFETAFFELLRLTREVLERIEIELSHSEKLADDQQHQSRGIKSGASALNALASRHFAAFSIGGGPGEDAYWLQQLVTQFKKKIYGQNPSAMGPYFRLLYQTFDLVAKAPLDEVRKVRYSNIARGQISEGAVLLLALNGLTWRGWNFVALIERFGLLEHMHHRYLKQFKKYLRVAYRENSFRGSKERALHKNEEAPPHKPFKFDKDPSQKDFEVTAPMTIDPDFEYAPPELPNSLLKNDGSAP